MKILINQKKNPPEMKKVNMVLTLIILIFSYWMMELITNMISKIIELDLSLAHRLTIEIRKIVNIRRWICLNLFSCNSLV